MGSFYFCLFFAEFSKKEDVNSNLSKLKKPLQENRQKRRLDSYHCHLKTVIESF